MNLPSKTDEAVLEGPTPNQDLACTRGDMVTRQDLNSAVDSKEAGGYDNKVYDCLYQGHNETVLLGHATMRKSFTNMNHLLLLKLICSPTSTHLVLKSN